MAGKPGCGGKKGKSGRRSLKDEALVKNVVDLSWQVINAALVAPIGKGTGKGKTIPLGEKRKIALEVVRRTAPQRMDLGVKAKEALKITFEVIDGANPSIQDKPPAKHGTGSTK